MRQSEQTKGERRIFLSTSVVDLLNSYGEHCGKSSTVLEESIQLYVQESKPATSKFNPLFQYVAGYNKYNFSLSERNQNVNHCTTFSLRKNSRMLLRVHCRMFDSFHYNWRG